MANGENISWPAVQPGDTLRRLRVRSGLSTRQVAALSRVVARNQGNNEFSISHARLVQVENEDSVPSIQKLFTLSSIYGVSAQELFAAYINLEAAARLQTTMPIPKTHLAALDRPAPVRQFLFRPPQLHWAPCGNRRTLDIVQAWGEVPVSLLEHLRLPDARYGFIGLATTRCIP